MATVGNYNHGSVTVGTTPTLIAFSPASEYGTSPIEVTNTGSVTVYLGGPTVSATAGANQGLPLTANASLEVPTSRLANPLYGVVASGTGTVNYLWPSTEFSPSDHPYTSDPTPA